MSASSIADIRVDITLLAPGAEEDGDEALVNSVCLHIFESFLYG